MSKLGSFFRGLGKGVLRALHLVAQLVTDQQVAVALQWVRTAAANQFVDNTRRRDFAVARVQAALHVHESLARYLVELAVQLLKHEEDAGIQKLEALLDDDGAGASVPPVVVGVSIGDISRGADAPSGLPVDAAQPVSALEELHAQVVALTERVGYLEEQVKAALSTPVDVATGTVDANG